MSVSSRLTWGRAVAGLFVVLAVSLISIPALAQSDSNPKYDVFVGYQWLHPGASVPAVNGDPTNPTPFQVPDMAKGFGLAFTYNFDSHWGGEADLGHNWGNDNYETTYSVGPRFIWRTDEANYFLHSLVSLNRVSIGGLSAGNGIGAVARWGNGSAYQQEIGFSLV